MLTSELCGYSEISHTSMRAADSRSTGGTIDAMRGERQLRRLQQRVVGVAARRMLARHDLVRRDHLANL